jgi:hypothetical protein
MRNFPDEVYITFDSNDEIVRTISDPEDVGLIQTGYMNFRERGWEDVTHQMVLYKLTPVQEQA